MKVLSKSEVNDLLVIMGYLTSVRNMGTVENKEAFYEKVLKPLEKITGYKIPQEALDGKWYAFPGAKK